MLVHRFAALLLSLLSTYTHSAQDNIFACLGGIRFRFIRPSNQQQSEEVNQRPLVHAAIVPVS